MHPDVQHKIRPDENVPVSGLAPSCQPLDQGLTRKLATLLLMKAYLPAAIGQNVGRDVPCLLIASRMKVERALLGQQ